MSGQDAKILVVCTGNQCRSPMAQAILARALPEAKVLSAGFAGSGMPCPPEVGEVMMPLGYDLSAHRSRMVSAALLQSSDLAIGMTRQHVIDLALLAPAAWQRTFTLADLVARGQAIGLVGAGNDLPAWVALVSAGRSRSDLVRLPLSGDVPDPMGGPLRGYVRSRDRLLELCSRLATLLVGLT